AVGYTVFALFVGSVWTAVLQHKAAVWLVADQPPNREQARRILRLPARMSMVSITLWALGTVVITAVAARVSAPWHAIEIAVAGVIGGIITTGLIYLLGERVLWSIMVRALEVLPPTPSARTTVLSRLTLTWALGSILPLLNMLLVLGLPATAVTPAQKSRTAIFLAAIGLATAIITGALLVRSIASPLRRLRAALRDIARGDLDVRVGVEDASEIGLLQGSVNDLVKGLAEQRRMRDLFGRHVGTEVAAHALEYGASLSGDVREVTALFVDVVDSTALADRLPPHEFVEKLNRFFAHVVKATDINGGLVNKFAGDAALCIFGAPIGHFDPATAALRAARRIRDDVRADGELDLGIGVATGQAFAGQLGTSQRLEYTVIGDPVNEASRLTEIAKRVPGRILASQRVIDAATDSELRSWCEFQTLRLRGRHTTTTAWRDSSTDNPQSSTG
ncbi:MAG: adenylate/guanylate cyclase domain-containing protein, partial [Sciscionella sp.]|nr:adenylate/guanylate cyclase domain-containing protein [Sciscionella sp.]